MCDPNEMKLSENLQEENQEQEVGILEATPCCSDCIIVDPANGCSVMEGTGTTASEPASHAEGQLTLASGQFSHAEGQKTVASALNAHSEGDLRPRAPKQPMQKAEAQMPVASLRMRKEA